MRPPLSRTSSIMWRVPPGPVAALSVPEADEVEPVRAEARGGVEHPAVVAFVGVLAHGRRTQLDRLDMERRPRLRGEKAGAPIIAGEVDRFLEKRRLVEGDKELEPRAARERGLGEQEIAAAGAAADGEIVRPDGEIGQRRADGGRRDRLLVRRKARPFAAGRVDHVAAEQHDLAGRLLVRFRYAQAISSVARSIRLFSRQFEGGRKMAWLHLSRRGGSSELPELIHIARIVHLCDLRQLLGGAIDFQCFGQPLLFE